jgi:zinc-ribbon domain
MFCNYCGASNPEGSSFCSTCGKAIARPPANESSSRMVAPMLAPSPSQVVATSPVTSPSNTSGGTVLPQQAFSPKIATPDPPVVSIATATPKEGILTESARAQFVDGLVAEIRQKIGDKPIGWACVVFILTLVLLTGLKKILAFILALVGAGLVFKFVKDSLEKKYLQPIFEYSDQMLVPRYNEVKADRRAASTRAAIWWQLLSSLE